MIAWADIGQPDTCIALYGKLNIGWTVHGNMGAGGYGKDGKHITDQFMDVTWTGFGQERSFAIFVNVQESRRASKESHSLKATDCF